MAVSKTPLGCACYGVSRRRFLAAGCATCAGAAGLLAGNRPARAAEDDRKLRIRIIYSLHAVKQPRPDWPNVGFDFQPVMDGILTELTNRCPGFEFVTSMANGPEAAQKILEEDKSAAVDGYLVYQLNCWNRVVQTIAGSGKPTLYADFQYGGSGGFLVYTAGFLRQKTPNVGFVASSRIEDLAAAVKCFEVLKKGGTPAEFAAATARVRIERTRAPGDLSCKPDALAALSPEQCLAKMKASKILAVGGGWPGIAPAIMEGMGIEVVKVPFEEVNAAWEAADKDQSRAIADRWQQSAAKIEDVSRETLEQSAAMYLAEKAVLEKHGANAFTMNCLGGFYGGHIHAYPCLGFYELLNEGLIGACECDLRSTATMVAMTALSQGRPGMISDPVVDTAKRQIIYAHCVASNKAFGPQGEANPIEILTHSEDRQGASLRSLLPLGYMTTTVEFAPERKTILFHQGKAVENDPNDRACRTKLAAEPVGDFEKLLTEWDQWGWHRVTFYGDLKEPVFALADAMGWKVLEEA
ncbi:MAG TPA: hypothetical protein VMY37_09880 [Thermoguttaceae bacterium]|nr:hypothetical protein [Thermoguttaceae bacterium]